MSRVSRKTRESKAGEWDAILDAPNDQPAFVVSHGLLPRGYEWVFEDKAGSETQGLEYYVRRFFYFETSMLAPVCV